jgi:paraquat-inducible protein A
MNTQSPPISAVDRERECHDCGLFQCVPILPTNGEANCLRCDAILRRTRSHGFERSMALSITSMVFYLIAVTSPFLTAEIVGRQTQTTMISLPIAFWNDGSWILALIVTATAIVAPFLKITVMMTVQVGLRTANPPRFLPSLFKWYQRIGPWAMVEVFLLGVFVAFTRLGSIATVQVGVALYAVAALMLTMVAADYLLDADEIWETMERRGVVPPPRPRVPGGVTTGCDVCGRVNAAPEGERCSRCHSVLRARRPNSVANTWALLFAAAMLYLPANIYPVMTIEQLGQTYPSTILGGARELLEAGMWPLALLVFVASLMVPMLKLLSLTLMLVQTRRGSGWRLHDRTRLYRLVEFIGRWSMIDVFMMATLVGLVHAGAIATILPGLGAVCFGSVVVLTMIATSCFDPRIMWDMAGEQGAEYHLYIPHTPGPGAGPSVLSIPDRRPTGPVQPSEA